MLPLPKPDWKEVRAWLQSHFPDVHHVSVDELAAWRVDPVRLRPVLVDIRTPAEQEISYIDGALFAHAEAEAFDRLKDLSPDTPIVAYCAVGLRSAKLVRALRLAGFTNVHNLEGAIFAWANRNLPLAYATGFTIRVHPYDVHWGVLLDPWRHATLPNESQ